MIFYLKNLYVKNKNYNLMYDFNILQYLRLRKLKCIYRIYM